MATKLTLSADAELVRHAKRLAAEQGMSLSAMFSQFIRAADAPSDRPMVRGKLTSEAIGLVRSRSRASDRRLLEDALSQKYGL